MKRYIGILKEIQILLQVLKIEEYLYKSMIVQYQEDNTLLAAQVLSSIVSIVSYKEFYCKIYYFLRLPPHFFNLPPHPYLLSLFLVKPALGVEGLFLPELFVAIMFNFKDQGTKIQIIFSINKTFNSIFYEHYKIIYLPLRNLKSTRLLIMLAIMFLLKSLSFSS